MPRARAPLCARAVFSSSFSYIAPALGYTSLAHAPTFSEFSTNPPCMYIYVCACASRSQDRELLSMGVGDGWRERKREREISWRDGKG